MMIGRERVANALAWLYAIGTLISLWLWLTFRLVHHIPEANIFLYLISISNIPIGPSIVSVALMALITHGLLHRKRLALTLNLFFQIIGLIGSATLLVIFALGLPVSESPLELISQILWLVISLALVIITVWLRPAFPAKLAPGSWLAAIAVLTVGLTIAAGAAYLLGVALSNGPGAPLERAAVVLLRAVGSDVPEPLAGVYVHPMAPLIISVVLGLSLITAVAVFTRTVRPTDSWDAASELRLRELLTTFGEDDSLGYVSTRRDRLLHFDSWGRAAIGYQVFGGVALASGDPIGDPDRWAGAISSWHAEIRRYGWTPAVLACSEAGARAYSHTMGFDILRLGDEAILETESFRLTQTSMTEVRRAWKRARREGIGAQIRFQSEMEAEEIARVRELAEEWRGGKEERGYSMELGRLGDQADSHLVIAVVSDQSGSPLALMTFLPWGRHGLSLDLMRRHPKAPNGINEFLVAELMAWAADHGIRRVSLNFAFLRHVFARAEDVAAAPVERASSKILGALDRFWQIQRLYRANAKYRPEWSPRYVAVASPLTIPQVAFAAGLAEGFLPAPFGLQREAPAGAGLNELELNRLREITSGKPPADDFSRRCDQTRHRLEHLEALRATGESGYPVGRRNALWLRDLHGIESLDPALEVIGRVRSIRDHGGVCFIDLTDAGISVQLLFEAGVLGVDQVHRASRLLDRGDLIGVRARPGASRNGTPSLLVDSWQVVAKSLQPIPWHGFNDPRARARNRCLDLLVHPDQLGLLTARSRAITAVRACLNEAGFTEVETPMLNTIHGGANARPFRTHINAYDTDLVLRIAPELALKRLVVAGMGAVFEIGKNFRNEGADLSHNPEFTVVEAYQPFADYQDMRRLTQHLIQRAAIAVHGRAVMPLPDSDGVLRLTDISGEWPAVSICDALSERLGREISLATDLDELIELARGNGVSVGPGWGPGKLIEELYCELIEASTVQPVFYLDFPAETSPLTAPHRTKPGLVERWDLVAGGMELGTAYSELADPLIQRRRLVEQSWHAAQGDAEAMEVDEDFLGALELGMPPTGGLGIGLDRLVMALTGANIRQVLSFPFVRPQR